MKKWTVFGGVFLLLYLGFLFATAPAKVLLSQWQLPGNISLSGVSGSIWQMQVKQLTSEQLVVNDIHANLSFWSLLRFKPSVQLSFGGGLAEGPEGNATVSISGQVIEAADVVLSMPAQDIAQQLNLPIPVDALGMLQLNAKTFVSGKPLCAQLTGQLVWQRAELIAMEQQVALGNLAAELSCEQGAIVAKINGNNDLGLAYSAVIRSAKQVSGNGYLTPGDDFPKPLRELLPFLGNPDQQGRYRLAL